ncbi:hypothetical protein V6Z11_A04G009000 [Gossypium hirsutum]
MPHNQYPIPKLTRDPKSHWPKWPRNFRTLGFFPMRRNQPSFSPGLRTAQQSCPRQHTAPYPSAHLYLRRKGQTTAANAYKKITDRKKWKNCIFYFFFSSSLGYKA